MVKRLRNSLNWTGLWLALVLITAPAVQAQGSATYPGGQSHGSKERQVPDRLPEKSSLAPAFSIPVEPLGFSAPGPIYLGQRNSLASLDFFDENRLLFTFRVPGLMHREAGSDEGG